MFRNLLLTLCVVFSVHSHAEIIDLGHLTQDTNTGLYWFDLDRTKGRSYNDILSNMGEGQVFEGYRYATADEAQTLWINLGLTDGTNSNVSLGDTAQYNNFLNAVDLLGDTFSHRPGDTGIMAITSTFEWQHSSGSPYHVVKSMYHLSGNTYVTGNTGSTSIDIKTDYLSSYLVSNTYSAAPVPVPASAWLFGSAIVGLAGFKRKR